MEFKGAEIAVSHPYPSDSLVLRKPPAILALVEAKLRTVNRAPMFLRGKGFLLA